MEELQEQPVGLANGNGTRTTKRFPTLKHFALWFMAQPLDKLFPVAVYNFGQAVSLVLFREIPYQVELVIALPGAAFPLEHRHPDVDSIEIHFSPFDVPLTINGQRAVPKSYPRLNDPARRLEPLYLTRITPETWHGSQPIPTGAAFMSAQEWLHGVEPSSVALNWEGAPISDVHGAQLK